MNTQVKAATMVATVIASLITGCSTNKNKSAEAQMTMPVAEQGKPALSASIDRFSDAAGHLQKRSASPSLPGPNAPVNFDMAPCITQGFGPAGDYVSYYNFDVQPTAAAPIYVFFKAGATTPVDGQHNIVDVIPGEAGYSDFWNVVKVTVPEDYVPDTIRSITDLNKSGFPTTSTKIIVNCPIVPAGSTASLRYNAAKDTGLHQGWYHDMVVNYFNFAEKDLTLTPAGQVPVSPIYVTFNKNPDSKDPASGPASGFKSDSATGRTHNVTGTVPEDQAYSPLWEVNVYDNQSFASAHDLTSVVSTKVLAEGVANVNCPIVAKINVAAKQ